MKVAILQCDQVLEKFQPQYVSYSFMIQHMFDSINETLEFDVFDCQQSHYPENINDFDFYITTGSKSEAYEDTPWIQRLIKFVQLLDKSKKKLIGICFGHQIIAMALHGKVAKSDKGWGVGVATNRIVSTPKWMREKKSELNIIVSHQDQIEAIPDHAIVIAESDFCPYFMLQWNNYFLSIQGHPEWNTDYSKTLMNHRRDIIPADRIEAGLESLHSVPDNVLFSQWILDFVMY